MRTGPRSSSGQYKPVRGLIRGVAVLEALNRAPGGFATVTELSRQCAMHRTTVKRLLESLANCGYVRHEDQTGCYWLTDRVQRLSAGRIEEPWVALVAEPLMRTSVSRLIWPCDLGSPDAGFMAIRASTHGLSGLSQHRAMVGERLPMLVTAAGRAYLAACSEPERKAHLAILKARTDTWGELSRDRSYVSRVLRQTRSTGYGFNHGEWAREPDFAAVAVSINAGDRVLGAINLVFPKSAITAIELDRRFLPALRRLADEIGRKSLAVLEG